MFVSSKRLTTCLCSEMLFLSVWPVSPMYTSLQFWQGILYTTPFFNSAGTWFFTLAKVCLMVLAGLKTAFSLVGCRNLHIFSIFLRPPDLCRLSISLASVATESFSSKDGLDDIIWKSIHLKVWWRCCSSFCLSLGPQISRTCCFLGSLGHQSN